MKLRHTPLSQNNFRAGGSCARPGEVADGSHLLPEMCLTFCAGEQAVASDSLTPQAGSGFGSGLDLEACQTAGQSLWRAPSQGLRVESGTGFSLGNVLLLGGFQDSGQVGVLGSLSYLWLLERLCLWEQSSGECDHRHLPLWACCGGGGRAGRGRLLSRVSGACTGALGVCFLTLFRGLSTHCICTVWSTAPPLLLVQLCHCRHRLNGRCPHSGTGRLEVRQKAASGRACPRCSSRGGMSVLPQGCLLAGFCPVGTFVHRLTLSSVAPPTPTPGDLGPHTCLGLSQHRASSSALGHRWAFPSGRRLLENQAVVVRGGGQGLRGTVS